MLPWRDPRPSHSSSPSGPSLPPLFFFYLAVNQSACVLSAQTLYTVLGFGERKVSLGFCLKERTVEFMTSSPLPLCRSFNRYFFLGTHRVPGNFTSLAFFYLIPLSQSPSISLSLKKKTQKRQQKSGGSERRKTLRENICLASVPERVL